MTTRNPPASPSPDDKDPRIAFFDRCAPTWDEDGLNATAARCRMGELTDAVGIRPGSDILEVGCGTGLLTQWLVREAAPGRVTAVDFSPEMIARALAKGIDAKFLLKDVCRDDLGDAWYDVVLCFHSFPHFRDQSAALRMLARSLKSYGRLAVVHLRGSDHINEFHTSVGGAVGGDLLPVGTQWVPLLEQAGLDCLELRDDNSGFLLVAAARAPS